MQWDPIPMNEISAESQLSLVEEDQRPLNGRPAGVSSFGGGGGGGKSIKSSLSRYRCPIVAVVFVLLLVVVTAVGISASYNADRMSSESRKRNVILMISDGFGPTSQNVARTFYQRLHGLDPGLKLPLDTILTGSVRTMSASSLVTDSAAGATAFSCGLKTVNRYVAVDDKRKPCGTVMESAHRQKYATGIVSTARITHATPAAFSAHVVDRDDESQILFQQLFGYGQSKESPVDLMFGGGRCFFYPLDDMVNKGCRNDSLDLSKDAAAAGWNLLTSRAQFDALQEDHAQYPLAAVFTPSHMSYELDRDPKVEPSLAEMTLKALNLLSTKAGADAGFFAMIEGGRIDMAGHLNDPAAHIADILAYNEAVQVAMHFVDSHPGTILISVSDHETGGLAAARQITPYYPEYLWRPLSMRKVRTSTEKAVIMLDAMLHGMQPDPSEDLIFEKCEESIQNMLHSKFNINPVPWYMEPNNTASGIASTFDRTLYPEQKYPNAYYATREDVRRIFVALSSHDHQSMGFNPSLAGEELVQAMNIIGDLVSKNAELGWSTHGHSGADVGLHVYDGFKQTKRSQYIALRDNTYWKGIPEFLQARPQNSNLDESLVAALSGNVENIEVGAWIAEYLQLDLAATTALVN